MLRHRHLTLIALALLLLALSPARPARAADPTALIVTVSQPGLHVLAYSALQAAGFPVASVDPANVQLSQGGTPIALHWLGDSDTAFESDERFLFYAPLRFNRYTATDGYTLSILDTPGLRTTTRSADPTGLPSATPITTRVLEQNNLYGPVIVTGQPLLGDRNGEPWYWQSLYAGSGSTNTLTIPFTLTNFISGTATLTIRLIGDPRTNRSVAQHTVQVIVNGTPIDTRSWPRTDAVTYTISTNRLVAGANTITVVATGAAGAQDTFWVDSLVIRYPGNANPVLGQLAFTGQTTASQYLVAHTEGAPYYAFDTTNPAAPVALTDLNTTSYRVYLPIVRRCGTCRPATALTIGLILGDVGVTGPRTYALAADNGLIAPTLRLRPVLPGTNNHQWLALTPTAFSSAITPLANLRATQGLNPLVVNLQTIYDHYDDGRATPQAIRNYLANAYTTGSPAPQYVVFVGDATFDPRRYLAASPTTYFPPFFKTLFSEGETTSDNQFVNFDADALPEIFAGRLPVNTLTEAQTVVNKIVAYESAGYQPAWQNNALFVSAADDSASNFPAENLALSASVPAPFAASQLTYGGNIDAMRASLFTQWNAGQGLLLFNGHSSWVQWAAQLTPSFEDLFDIYFLPDLNQLTNADRLPVVLSLTCFTGAYYYYNPEFFPGYGPISATMDESLLRRPNGGAVAVWGSTGLSNSSAYNLMAEGFLTSLYLSDQPILGLNVYAGQSQVYVGSLSNHFMIDLFHLFGDPATRLPFAGPPSP